MNRKELADYVFNFWLGFINLDEYNKTEEELFNEIYENLETLNGVEKELDMVRSAFESGWDEKSKEYQDLDDVWNELNYYKTNLQKEN
jgi:uncharacterized damage-inducible protein DinB